MIRFDWHVRANLKPRHFQLLVSLDELRSLVKVAESLNVTQPAVSKSLADLERLLEVRLFERTGRGLEPTVYGQCMVRHARTLLTDLRQAHDELTSLRRGDAGRVGVGVLPAAAPVLVPKAIAALKAEAPRTTVLLHEGPLATLLPDLQVGNLDLIVGTVPPGRLTEGLVSETLYSEDPIVVVAGSHHPLVRRRKLRWSDLAAYPWIIPPPGASMREPLERALGERGLTVPANRVESVALLANKTILLQTLTIGFFSRRIAEHYGDLGLVAILPLEMQRLVGPIGAMWMKGRPFLPATARMLDALRRVANGSAVPAAL